MLKEGIGFKDYLHGPMDAGTKLKVKFRTGDIGLRERRRRHRTVDEEDDEFKCDCGFECEDRVHVVAECPLYKKEREVLLSIPSGPLSTVNVRFIVDKDEERSEVKVQEGPEGFPFLYGEEYNFKYSFKLIEDMKVATRYTHLGQLKGSAGGYMIKGDPIYSLTANKHGLHVRFSNLETIEDYHDGLDMPLDWDAVTGEWVHVEIITTFGKSMVVRRDGLGCQARALSCAEGFDTTRLFTSCSRAFEQVNISGAVSGTAVWPSDLKPVAWHRDSEMVRMKLGLYHSIHNVHDQEVIYRDISIEGPNGIIRTSPPSDIHIHPCRTFGSCPRSVTTCPPSSGSTIDWNCMFGVGSLVEVEARGGKLVSCPSGTDAEPCSRFIVPKEKERAEAQKGVGGFQFAKGETYIFKYSFRAKDGMKVSGSSTRLGQMKGVSGGFQLKGNPLFSVTANNNGINVRFNNEDDDNVEGMDEFLSWEDATGEWVHVEIQTTFGEVHGGVYFSGAVNGKAVWPPSYKPVAWNDDADTIMFKLGLYHIKNKVGRLEIPVRALETNSASSSLDGRSSPSTTNRSIPPPKVADGEVEYKNISIQGPNGLLRTSSVGDINHRPPQGITSLGCVKDARHDRLLDNIYRFEDLTPECWCGTGAGEVVEGMFRHGSATCNMACSGDKDKTCGGPYLGWFKDNRFNRALSKKQTSSNDMTLEDAKQ
ncbi:unnamed protein product [Ectocarpus sp. CCAP 1310/34]|nr:unnamed protein product [Ectocarpus sp. CCAP 1310/34]